MSNNSVPIKEFRLDLSDLTYVGSLGMSRLPTFRSPVAGLPMSHWK